MPLWALCSSPRGTVQEFMRVQTCSLITTTFKRSVVIVLALGRG